MSILVDDISDEVVLNLRLLRCLNRLPLARKSTMNLLEIGETFKSCSGVSWALLCCHFLEAVQNTVCSQSNLIISIAKVVKHCMNACNDTTSIVKHTSLLHPVMSVACGLITGTLLLFLEELGVDDDGEAGLGNKSKQVLLKAIDFAKCPLLGQATLSHVVRENLGV